MTISTTTLKNAAFAIECDLWTDPATGANYLAKDGAILRRWEPATNDEDAFRLMVALKMQVIVHDDWVEGMIDGILLSSPASCYSADGCMLDTTRRAIVGAAARFGEELECQ
jgi:hypothetical protein